MNNILITGAGYLSSNLLLRLCMDEYANIYNNIVVISRGEKEQHELKLKLHSDKIKFILCDIRNNDRLTKILINNNIKIVIHTGALKRIDNSNYENIEEMISINYKASLFLAMICKELNIKVFLVSTDKAVQPINLYGFTKMLSELEFLKYEHNVFRFGNIRGSTGSVLSHWNNGGLDLVDKPEKTRRFFIDVEEAVKFIIKNLDTQLKSCIFIPLTLSVSMKELWDDFNIGGRVQYKTIKLSKIEKRREILINKNESLRSVKDETGYIIYPIKNALTSKIEFELIA